MGPTQAIDSCRRKYAVFSGRSSRSEFWWFAYLTIGGAFAAFWLVETLLPLELPLLSLPSFAAMIAILVLAVLPFTAATWRRLHDAGFSGRWVLIPYGLLTLGIGLSLIDSKVLNRGVENSGMLGVLVAYGGFLLTGPLVLLVCALPSQPGPNKYGPNPHEVTP